MRDVSKFGRDTSTREVLEGIDLSGKIALITGGSSGLGQETARALAEKGAEVILTARDVAKGDAVTAEVEAGAATSVLAVSAPELEGRGGLYLEDCHVAAVNDAPDALDGVKSYALDAESAERLWTLSEEVVGERFALG
jgi:NAD(P)-dependent dehydrogenase (short-subunit alcohol dehydrogenase family)